MNLPKNYEQNEIAGSMYKGAVYFWCKKGFIFQFLYVKNSVVLNFTKIVLKSKHFSEMKCINRIRKLLKKENGINTILV